MVSDFFATLLRCEGCSHVLEYHGQTSCKADGCACTLSRQDVIDTNVESVRRDIRIT